MGEHEQGVRGAKVGSMNCNGLGDRNKRNKVLTWLKNKPENIILLQETHSTLELENEWKKTWDGELYFSHGNNVYITVMSVNKVRNKCQGRVLRTASRINY